MKNVLLALFLLLLTATAWAQEKRIITGTITDKIEKIPVPLAYVILKSNPAIGTTTDFNGNYSLKIPESDDAVLIFRYTGYKTIEIAVGSKNVVNAIIEPDVKMADEVVVTGFRSEKKIESAGNSSTVKGEVFQNNPTPSFDAALQGRASGVQISQSGGLAGAGVQVRVRGQGSVSASSEPLYVVDGIPIISGGGGDGGGSTGGINPGFQLNPLADLNPADIETLEILKDASSTAQYGSRGANGVVVITTRKGRAGKTKFTFTYYTGIEQITNKVDVLDSKDYVQTVTNAYLNSYNSNPNNVGRQVPDLGEYITVPRISALTKDVANATNVDYLDYIIQNGKQNEASLNASGGNAKTTFYVNGTYRRQEGTLIGNVYERVSGKFNLSSIVSSKLRIGLNTNVVFTQNNLVQAGTSPGSSGGSAFGGFAAAQYRSLPIFPVLWSDIPGAVNNYAFNPYFNAYDEYAGTNIYLTQNRNYASLKREVFRNLANLTLDYRILPNLSYRAEVGLEYYSQVDFSNLSRFLRQSRLNQNLPTASSTDSRIYYQNVNINQIVTYEKEINENNHFDATLVQNYNRTSNFNNSVSSEEFPNDNTQSVSSGARQVDRGGNESAYAFISGLLIAKYGYAGKYFVQASGRYEGSSRFGKTKRYGFFPSVGLNWIASEEEFIKNIKPISLLKLRGSVGITGNAAGIGNFQSLGLYSPSGTYNLNPSTSPNQIANPDLTWEKSRQLDVSVDVGLFKNAIEASLTYFNRTTYDMLLALTLPPSSGYGTGRYYKNSGSMRNRGWEVTLTTRQIQKDNISWRTDFNISFIKNTLVDLGGLRYNEVSGNANIANYTGHQLSSFFLPVYAGVNEQGEELIYRAERYKDGPNKGELTGNLTGEKFRPVRLNQVDSNRVAQFDKSIYPKFFGGFTNTFTFHGLELSAHITYTYGNYVLDDGERLLNYIGSNGTNSNNLRKSTLNDGIKRYYSNAPLVYRDGDNIPQDPYTILDPLRLRASTRFLHDASFLRLKMVTIAYNLPKKWIERARLTNVRVYGTVSNILTFTKYPGWDPEVVGNLGTAEERNLQQGITTLDFPQVKSYIIGVNIGF